MLPVAFILIITLIAPLILLCDSVKRDDEVRLTLLAQEWNSYLRVRRAAGTSLPDHLSFGVPVNGEDVVLRLRRSTLLRTVTSDGPVAESSGKTFGNAAVYTDQGLGSTMIVKLEVGDYKLKGSFIHGDREWRLEPVHGTGDASGESNTSLHRVFTVQFEDSISFGADAIQDKSEALDIVRTARGKTDVLRHHFLGKRHRQKRAAVKHVIDIAFVVDFSDFVKWQSYVGPSQAIPEMRLWYTYVAESINVRYETIKDPDIAISTTVTVLKILTDPQSSTFISRLQTANGEINGTEGLSSFRDWYPNQTDIPTSAHYMLFTGFDIIGAAGIAYSGRVCTSFGLSICENSFTGSMGGVAAHELGHSLSAIHDMDTRGTNSCTDNSQYVMAAVFKTPVSTENVGHPWRFSNCSIDSFKRYLAGVTCTLSAKSPNVLPAAAENQRAGEVLNRDEQCRLSFRNDTSFFCQQVQENNGGLEQLCGGMFCSIPNNSQGFCQTTVPQEFTDCADDKWCVAGMCVNKTDEITDSTSDSTTLGSTGSVTNNTSTAPSTNNTTAPSSTSGDVPITESSPTSQPTTENTTLAGTTPPSSTTENTTLAGITQASTTTENTTLAGITQASTTTENTTLAGITPASTTTENTTLAGNTPASTTTENTTMAGITPASTTTENTTMAGITPASTTTENTTMAGNTLASATTENTTLAESTLTSTTTENTTLAESTPTSIFTNTSELTKYSTPPTEAQKGMNSNPPPRDITTSSTYTTDIRYYPRIPATNTERRYIFYPTIRMGRTTTCPPFSAWGGTTQVPGTNQNTFRRCLMFLFNRDMQGYLICLRNLILNSQKNSTRG